jgi:hypothetical protein
MGGRKIMTEPEYREILKVLARAALNDPYWRDFAQQTLEAVEITERYEEKLKARLGKKMAEYR